MIGTFLCESKDVKDIFVLIFIYGNTPCGYVILHERQL